jgi:3-hydroxybutyryl-CoA dehydrogenase
MPIERVGVVGVGLMGAGIGECAARAGLDVTVYEPSAELVAAGMKRVEASLRHQVDRERIEPAEVERIMERIQPTDDLAAAADADLVIEAVPEDEDLKRQVFSQLSALAPHDAILASNTSSIPIAELASATDRPDQVLGLHFFSPVPAMQLVEIVRALHTSEETLAAAEGFSLQIGKHPIETKDRSGFIVNMLLVPYLMAAVRMFEEGFATRDDIDEGMRLGCGHPMGPLRLCDFIGLDVLISVCDSLYDEFRQSAYAPPPLLKRMVVSGQLGKKTGRGFYDYA